MRLSQQQLEAHLWGAANILRGKTAGQDYKNYSMTDTCHKRGALGLGTVAVDAFSEHGVEEAAALAKDEQALYLLPVGRPR